MRLTDDQGVPFHCPRCLGDDWAMPPAGAALHVCTGCGALVTRPEMLLRWEIVLPWPGDCPNRADDSDGNPRCCPGDDWGACDDYGPCGPCNDVPCHAEFGDWGAWRAVAAPLAQGYARAMAHPACLAYMRARLMFEARATLPAAGWSA